MTRLPNYIEGSNPCRLAGPPTWFLQQLWDFDSSLVIVPSKQGFYYRLTQRRPLQLPENMVNEMLHEQADSQMMASYGLVPITTILATANWSNPYIFVELRRRAPWRMGGAQKYSDMIDAQERQDALQKNVEQNEKLDYLAKDAWRYYNKKIGVRSHLWSPTTKSRKTPAQASGAVITQSRNPYKPDVMTTWLNPGKSGSR